MLADCVHFKDSSHIYDRSCQQSGVGGAGGGGVRRQIKARNLVSESIQNRCHGNIFFSDWLSYLHSGRLTYFFPFKSCNWVTRIIRLLFRTRGINIKPILINAQTFFPRSWNQEKLIKIDLISLVMYTNSYLCILLVMSDIFFILVEFWTYVQTITQRAQW